MPPFSPVPEETKEWVMFNDTPSSISMPQPHADDSNKAINDSQDMPYKPLILELASPSSFSTASNSTSSTSLSSSEASFEASAYSSPSQSHQHQHQLQNTKNSKMKRNVSFDADTDVLTVEAIHHPQDIQNQWYSKRELHIIRHKIRSLIKWCNLRDTHYFEYHEQEQVEYYDDDSQEIYLRNAPPPPQPPCVTFYDECLFGLEKHMSREKQQVRELKYNSKSAVFHEQEHQKQTGHYDEHRLAYSYAQTAAASQQEAWEIARFNAEESEQHRQELEAQQRYEAEQRIHFEMLQEIREREQRRIESLETSLLSQQDSDLEHLYLGEGGRPPKNPFHIVQNWKACFGKLFRGHEDCEIDSDEDCLNSPPRQPKRHDCLFSTIQEEEEEAELYYR